MLESDALGLTVSLLIAAMCGLGVGSGGLFMVYLTLVLSIPQLTAQGINLVFFVFCSGASLLWHYSRRAVDPKLLLPLSAAGAVGAFFGSELAAVTEPQMLQRCFGIFLTLTGVISLLRSLRSRTKKKSTR